MKLCLNCQTEYKSKKEFSKFCSPKCRVQYNRKNPKPKDEVTPLQMRVLYDAVLGLISGSGHGKPPLSAEKAATGFISAPKSNFHEPATAQKTMNEYFQEKREIISDEGHQEWLSRVNADKWLKDWQKNILKTTNQ